MTSSITSSKLQKFVLKMHLRVTIGLAFIAVLSSCQAKSPASPVNEDAALLPQAASPVKQDAALLQQEASPVKQDAALLSQAASPVKQDAALLPKAAPKKLSKRAALPCPPMLTFIYIRNYIIKHGYLKVWGVLGIFPAKSIPSRYKVTPRCVLPNWAWKPVCFECPAPALLYYIGNVAVIVVKNFRCQPSACVRRGSNVGRCTKTYKIKYLYLRPVWDPFRKIWIWLVVTVRIPLCCKCYVPRAYYPSVAG